MPVVQLVRLTMEKKGLEGNLKEAKTLKLKTGGK